MEHLNVSLKRSRNRKKQFNTGMTMLETVIAVALVSIFFTVVAVVLPATLEQYVMMRRTSEALTISSVLHSGIEMEIGTSYHPCVYAVEAAARGDSITPSKVYPSGNPLVDVNDYGLVYTNKNYIHYFPQEVNVEGANLTYNYTYDYNPDTFELTKYSITCVGKPEIYGSVTDKDFYDKYFVKATIEYDSEKDSATSKIVVYLDELLDEGVTYQAVLEDTDNTKIDSICKTSKTILMYN